MGFVSPVDLDKSSCIITHYQDNLFKLDSHAGNYQIDSIDDNPIHKEGISPRILFMGDSRAKLGETFSDLSNDIYNLGVSGATTWSIRNKLYRVDGINPNIVFIFTGINDRYYMSPNEFYDNLLHISTYMKARNIICYIIDQTLSQSVRASSDSWFAPYRLKMEHITFSPYINVAYTDDCFIDNYCHLNVKGYSLVSKTINSWIIKYK